MSQLAVAAYYDEEAAQYEERYWKNPILQRMRQSFRSHLMRNRFRSVLEIGFGTGIDLEQLAAVRDDVQLHGLEASAGMLAQALDRVDADLRIGEPERLSEVFEGKQFDAIYVFFGALNTIRDLDKAADQISRSLKPGATATLTFVNKHYVMGTVLDLLRFKFTRAFARSGKRWRGYSPEKYIETRLYTPGEIRASFHELELVRSDGYCMVHPGWHMHGLAMKLRRFLPYLWKVDRLLARTPAREFGEYTLFTFKKPGCLVQ